MNLFKRSDNWLKTRKGFTTLGVVLLVLAYISGSRAIDTGSLWEYAIALLSLVGGVQNLVRAIRNK